jgi:stage V sporulation protein SpoVS
MSLTLGVDIDSYAIHVCAIPGDGGPPTAVTHAIRKKGDSEHQAIGNVAYALAASLKDIRDARRGGPFLLPPGATLVEIPEAIEGVWIERGYGSSRRADFILGCIYGAVIVACGHVLPGVAVRPMKASDWKKQVTAVVGVRTKTGTAGNGNAPKAMANAACTEIWQNAWPLAIVPTDPNQLDAFGVALAASTL